MNSSKVLLSTLIALPLLTLAPVSFADDTSSDKKPAAHKDVEEMKAKMHEIHEEMQKLKASTAEEMKKLRQEMQKLKDEAHEKVEHKRAEMKKKHEEHEQKKAHKDSANTTGSAASTTTTQ